MVGCVCHEPRDDDDDGHEVGTGPGHAPTSRSGCTGPPSPLTPVSVPADDGSGDRLGCGQWWRGSRKRCRGCGYHHTTPRAHSTPALEPLGVFPVPVCPTHRVFPLRVAGGAALPTTQEALDLSPPRGTRDFYPEDMRLQQWLFTHWRDVSRAYGFSEYDAPVLENEALYVRKAGEEVSSPVEREQP